MNYNILTHQVKYVEADILLLMRDLDSNMDFLEDSQDVYNYSEVSTEYYKKTICCQKTILITVLLWNRLNLKDNKCEY